MKLPGGLIRAGERRRDVEWKAPSGEVELGITAGAPGASLPARVSDALVTALATLAGEAPTLAAVGDLCVADRQFLMHRLAEQLDLGDPWLTVACEACGERFDMSVGLADLPVHEAGEGFPYADVETSFGRVRARVPTGADQAAIAALPAAQGERALLARCAGGDVDRFTGDDIARIEAALEEVSPAVVTRLGAACAECGHEQAVNLDPYLALRATPASTLEDVHTIASAYHWSEREILALPRERRQFYLARIDRARGVVS